MCKTDKKHTPKRGPQSLSERTGVAAGFCSNLITCLNFKICVCEKCLKYPINSIRLHDNVSRGVYSSQKKKLISLCLKPEMWQIVTKIKFKHGENFFKALYITHSFLFLLWILQETYLLLPQVQFLRI